MNPMPLLLRGINHFLRIVCDIVMVFPEDTPPFTQRLSGAGFLAPFFFAPLGRVDIHDLERGRRENHPVSGANPPKG